MSEPTPTPPPQAHLGPGPDVPRIGRKTVALGFLALVALVLVLTAQFSRKAPGQGAPPAVSSGPPPVDLGRLEELARRLIETERQKEGPVPFSDDGTPAPTYLGGGEFDDGSTPDLASWPDPPASSPAPPAPIPGPRASDAPLVPPGVEARPAPQPAADPTLDLLTQLSARTPFASALPPPASPDLAGTLGPARAELRPAPSSPYLPAGTLVPLVLAHELATDVPGPVLAVVAADVRNPRGSGPAILPRGSRCLGRQEGRPSLGEARVLLTWSQCQRPDGTTLTFPPMPSASASGSGGVPGEVRSHWGARLGHAFALSLISAGFQLSQPQRRSGVEGFAPTPGQVIAGEVGEGLADQAAEIIRRGLDRPPTITVPAGTRFHLVLTQDLTVH